MVANVQYLDAELSNPCTYYLVDSILPKAVEACTLLTTSPPLPVVGARCTYILQMTRVHYCHT